MKQALLLLLTLTIFSSCAELAVRNQPGSSYRDRQKEEYKKCVKELFNEGLNQENAHAICKDIYDTSANDAKN